MSTTVLAPDITYTRVVSRFPTPGDLNNPYGQSTRVLTETFDSRAGSGPDESVVNSYYMVVPVASYYSRSVGITEFDYLVGGYIEWQDITANIAGSNRKFVGFKRTSGRISPAQVSVVRQIAEGVADVGSAIGNGVKGILLNAMSLLNIDGSVRNLYNQPFPAHHIGIIQMDGHLRGISGEGSALDGNSVTLSDVDVRWSQIIMTEAYHEFMQIRRLWNSFLQMPAAIRQNQIKIFQGYLTQRDEFILRQRRGGQITVGDPFPPNPLSDDQVHPYIWWAWSRRLDPTAPPPDTRQYDYPGYDYSAKRSWFIDSASTGLPMY